MEKKSNQKTILDNCESKTTDEGRMESIIKSIGHAHKTRLPPIREVSIKEIHPIPRDRVRLVRFARFVDSADFYPTSSSVM